MRVPMELVAAFVIGIVLMCSLGYLLLTPRRFLWRFVAGGVDDVVVMCPGIFVDSVDTTLEIDTDMRTVYERGFAEASRDCSFMYVPALNAGRRFAWMMARIIVENLRGWDDFSDDHDRLYGPGRTMRRTEEDPRPDVAVVEEVVEPALLDVEAPAPGELGADGRIDPEEAPVFRNVPRL